MKKLSYTRRAVRDRLKKFGLEVRVVEKGSTVWHQHLTAQLLKNRRVVGSVSLCRIDYWDKDFWQTESVTGIPQKYRGMGIGLYLYEEVLRFGLKRGYKVGSSQEYDIGEDALKVWKKLRGRFRVQKRGGRYRVYGLKR